MKKGKKLKFLSLVFLVCFSIGCEEKDTRKTASSIVPIVDIESVKKNDKNDINHIVDTNNMASNYSIQNIQETKKEEKENKPDLVEESYEVYKAYELNVEYIDEFNSDEVDGFIKSSLNKKTYSKEDTIILKIKNIKENLNINIGTGYIIEYLNGDFYEPLFLAESFVYDLEKYGFKDIYEQKFLIPKNFKAGEYRISKDVFFEQSDLLRDFPEVLSIYETFKIE